MPYALYLTTRDLPLALLQGVSRLVAGLAWISISATAIYVYRRGGLSSIAVAFPRLWRLGAAFVILGGLNHILASFEIIVGETWLFWLSGVERFAMAVSAVWFAHTIWRAKDELAFIGRVLGEVARQRMEAPTSLPAHGLVLPPGRLPR